jgi:hypothetical protein
MTKVEFVKIVEDHSNSVNIFDGRFSKLSENKYKWVIPAVETYEQLIIVNDTNVNIVESFFGGDKTTTLTFEEITKKFKLIK